MIIQGARGSICTTRSGLGLLAALLTSPSADPGLRWPEIISRSPIPGMSPSAAAEAQGRYFPRALRLLLCEHDSFAEGGDSFQVPLAMSSSGYEYIDTYIHIIVYFCLGLW
ncbi:unnamed protein product [Spodoptera exigua]|nr:unnamed protein product [Spodoptera exigua]